MKKITNFVMRLCLVFALGCMLFTCSNDPLMISSDEADTSELNSKMASEKKSMDNKFHFTASLKGSNETTPNDSKAAGEAIVHINKEETMIHYKLIVANIENVTMSHFHMAPAGSDGGPVAWLYKNLDQPSGMSNGVIAEGQIEESDLIGGLVGKSIADLIEAIRNGRIYVNVHTSAYPGGELRGQL